MTSYYVSVYVPLSVVHFYEILCSVIDCKTTVSVTRFHPWTKLKTLHQSLSTSDFVKKILLKREKQDWEQYFIKITRYHYRYLESNEALLFSLLFCIVKVRY